MTAKQDGIDIRTLQQRMGNSDIASTMVYLKGVCASDDQARISQDSIPALAYCFLVAMHRRAGPLTENSYAKSSRSRILRTVP